MSDFVWVDERRALERRVHLNWPLSGQGFCRSTRQERAFQVERRLAEVRKL